MVAYDKDVNMSSNYETKEEPIGAQAKYLGIKDNREPSAGHLDQANKREGGTLARAVSMVERHNERGTMHDNCHRMDVGTAGE